MRRFFLLSCFIYSISLSASDIKTHLIEEDQKITPQTFHISKGDVSFDLMGTQHNFPYKWLHPKAYQLIESSTLFVSEIEPLSEEEKIIFCQKNFPRSSSDQASFDKLFQTQEYKELPSPLKIAFQAIVSYELNFGFTLSLFSRYAYKETFMEGMDFCIEKSFQAAGKGTLGLISFKEQLCSDDSHGLSRLSFDEISSELEKQQLNFSCFFYLEDPSLRSYPRSLDDIRQQVKEEQFLNDRDPAFIQKSIRIATKNPEDKVLVGVGIFHLPFMLDAYTSDGWTVTKLFEDQ